MPSWCPPDSLQRSGTASPQAAHFSLPPGSESSVAPLRLLSPREPLRWVRAGAPIKGGFFTPHELKKRAVHRMSLFFGARGGTVSPQAVHPSLPPGGESSVAPLWLLSPREPLRWIRAGAPIKADSSHPHRPKKDRLLPVFLFGPWGCEEAAFLRGPRADPTERFAWGKEPQRSERAFADRQ